MFTCNFSKAVTASLGVLSTCLAVAPKAEAFSFTVLSNQCITARCESLDKVYNVDGGLVMPPIDDPALTPGTNTQTAFDPINTSSQVKSFTVTRLTGTSTDPVNTQIEVSDLLGAFELFWGSVDTHNVIDFYDGTNLVTSFTGTDLASSLGIGPASPAGNYKFDAYVSFAGVFDKAVLYTTQPGNEKSFEVAVATVPEPVGVLSFLTAGLITAGSLRKRSAEA
ncbi:MAG: hypothetical protein ACO3EZ_01295 [Prochlorotrichaceae cyanobacterium]|jgi:hypothetical protein